jgi:hypothetical protein
VELSTSYRKDAPVLLPFTCDQVESVPSVKAGFFSAAGGAITALRVSRVNGASGLPYL